MDNEHIQNFPLGQNLFQDGSLLDQNTEPMLGLRKQNLPFNNVSGDEW